MANIDENSYAAAEIHEEKMMGKIAFCLFFFLGCIAATISASPIAAAGAYIAAAISLLADSIEKAAVIMKKTDRSADEIDG